jgi:hypothetical protein
MSPDLFQARSGIHLSIHISSALHLIYTMFCFRSRRKYNSGEAKGFKTIGMDAL